MIDLYRRLVGMRCPACDTPQPVFNLRTTYAGGVGVGALQDDVACISCASRLKLEIRHGAFETWTLRILIGLVQFALSVIVFLACMIPLIYLFGVWGLLGLPIYVVCATLVGAWFMGQAWPLTLTMTACRTDKG